MNDQLKEKYSLILEHIKNQKSEDPIAISKNIMHMHFINIHGPEHHYLDGAALLVAYKNAGGNIDLDQCLIELGKRTSSMPGAMCGYWGICGSVAAIGAALSIIHHTGPLSDDQFYRDHMEYTSSVIAKMGKIGGPRCCKRNAFLSILSAAAFIQKKYHLDMKIDTVICEFNEDNPQCIKERCPFYMGHKKI